MYLKLGCDFYRQRRSSNLYSATKHRRSRHSCDSRNPEVAWIPGQARNDKLNKIHLVMDSIDLPNNSKFSPLIMHTEEQLRY